MVVNIQTKHDAKTNFFYLQSWCEISEMTYPTQHMHENDMRFSYQSDFRITIFMIPIPILTPQGLIPILIPIIRFTKICDSNSDSDSSVSQKNLIPIPIQTNQALIPILILESFTTL